MWSVFDIIAFSIGFGSGGALIWFGKTKIQSLVLSANALSAKLHAEADAITNAAKSANL
jgi:hypothetical protein